MKLWFVLLLFLFVSALVIVSNGNYHLKDSVEAKSFATLYYSWLVNTGMSVGKVTGYVIKFEWLPNKNNTAYNSSK